MIGETREKDSGAIQEPTRDRDNSRAFAIEPQTAKESRDAQHKDADGEGQRDFGNTPAKLLREGHAENTPGVNGAECNLQKNTGDSDTPTVCHSSRNSRSLRLRRRTLQ